MMSYYSFPVASGSISGKVKAAQIHSEKTGSEYDDIKYIQYTNCLVRTQSYSHQRETKYSMQTQQYNEY